MATTSPIGRTRMRARERFLDGSLPVGAQVREEIRASWVRSQELSVGLDRIDPAYTERTDAPRLLFDCAAPILRELATEIANEPVAILLTDARGVVLDRVCGETDLARRLDAQQLAPGFTYAEASVGTNGIGTALETRSPTLVTGGEHFVGELCQFSCAGVPIVHPHTSAVIGVIDLTALASNTNQLLLSFARSIAGRIQERLTEEGNPREIALIREYLSTCHHTGGAVLALSGAMTVMNPDTQQIFDAADQSALVARMADAEGTRIPMTLLADLPSGQTARLEYRPAFTGAADLAGGIVRVQTQTTPASRQSGTPSIVHLPCVVGISPTWQRACRAVLESRRRDEWVVIEGEEGVGKYTLLGGAHNALHPAEHFRVLDAADITGPTEDEAWINEVADELDGHDGGSLILRRVHLLGADAVTALSQLLTLSTSHDHSGRRPWVAITLATEPRSAAIDAEVLPHFPHTVEAPVLRHHLEDLPRLAAHLLGRTSREGQLAVGAAAMNQMMRMPWQGNVEQLRRVLAWSERQRRTGTIGLDDLPPECRSVSRRLFSRIESLERDAIVESLDTHHGNKEAAATALGMSRATIYRKIKGFGIRPSRTLPAGNAQLPPHRTR